jgi:hypothetical protein
VIDKSASVVMTVIHEAQKNRDNMMLNIHRFITYLALISSALTLAGCQSNQSSQGKPPSAMPPTSSASMPSPSSMPSLPTNAPSSPSKQTSKPKSSSSTQQGQQTTQGGQPASSNPNQGQQASTSQGEGDDQDGQSSSQANSDATQDSGQSGEASEFEQEITIGEPAQSQSDEIDFSEEDTSNSNASQSNETASSQSQNSQNASQSSAQSQSSSASTDSERVAQMEEQLEESMSDYDGMILRERDYIQNRENQKGSQEEVARVDRADLYDEAGEGESTGKPGNQTAQRSVNNESSGRSGENYEMEATARKGDFKHNKTHFPAPTNIPSGHDDDVVARQIREAATREADPKLREKLWQEYRKYKKQSAED